MNRLQEVRKKRRLTQKELADRSNIKLQTIQKLEIGANNIAGARGETLYALASALGTTIEYLMGKEDLK